MTTRDRLVALHQLDDFTVASGDPDPRGWAVVSSDGQTIGQVADLIIDTGAMKAQYLDVALDRAMSPREEPQPHVFVPTGSVRIGEREQREQRISLPSAASEIVACALSEPAPAAPFRPDETRWPVLDNGRCDVRITPRGGHHG